MPQTTATQPASRSPAGYLLAAVMAALAILLAVGVLAGPTSEIRWAAALISLGAAGKVVTTVLGAAGRRMIATAGGGDRGGQGAGIRGIALTYLGGLYRIVYMLTAQAVVVSLAFVVFPVGFFLVFIHAITGVMVALGSGSPGESMLLCRALGVVDPYCIPLLVGLHAVQIGLAYLGMKNGDRLLDLLADGLEHGLDEIDSLR